MRWLPLPIVMGMFVGSSLGQVTAVFQNLAVEPAAVGAAVAGYLAARALGQAWLPPVGLAAIAGMVAAALTGRVNPAPLHWSAPLIAPVWPSFSLDTFFALSVPLVVMAVGIGNVQGIGFLVGQGYRPPISLLTVVVGLNSAINALFGGHPSTVARNGVAIVAGEDAGPRDQRYVANLVASLCLLLLALGATMASALPQVLPPGLVAALAGLAILSALMDALRKSVATDLSAGAFFALTIAASPLTLFGIGSAFWALVGGLLVSRLVEWPALSRALSAYAPGPDAQSAPPARLKAPVPRPASTQHGDDMGAEIDTCRHSGGRIAQ
jgi:benzoate membrane transport protein